VGIALALLVRGAAIMAFALRMLRSRGEPVDPEGPVVRVAPRPSSHPGRRLGRFVRRHNGRRSVTPIGLALLAIVAADITFAVDSIPAAFGITTDAFTIWLANALALLGLVSLLVLVRALVKRFRYMRQTVSAVLVFIGVRLLLEHVAAIAALASLAAIAAILGVGALASVIADRREPPSEQASSSADRPAARPTTSAPQWGMRMRTRTRRRFSGGLMGTRA
jgi:tellurite resistance protein TerC